MKHLMRVAGLLALCGAALPAWANPGDIVLVSVSSEGEQGNFPCWLASISDDGEQVAFQTYASNLFAGDQNISADVALRDLALGQTAPASTSSSGTLGSSTSGPCMISGNGRYIVFESAAPNLVAGDTNGVVDIFRRDLLTGVTERISVGAGGAQANGGSSSPTVSADGRYVAFDSIATNLTPLDNNSQRDIFVRDTLLGTTVKASVSFTNGSASGHSYHATISRDGRYVAFDSLADNLVRFDAAGKRDVFVRDMVAQTTRRISVAFDGFEVFDSSFGPCGMSADGRYVAYLSFANDIVDGDTNFSGDIFIFDQQTGVNERVSLDSAGAQANFGSRIPTLSADGRFVCFASSATNLVPGDTNAKDDVFVRDRLLGLTTRVNLTSDGEQSANWGDHPQITPDARYVIFDSFATDLVPDDLNANTDVFRKELRCPSDVNADGVVDLGDFFAFFGDFDTGAPAANIVPPADVDLADFFAFLAAFDAGC